MDQTPQSLVPAQDSGPLSSITAQPAPPQSSITAQPAPPQSSITAQPAPPQSSITAQGGSVVVAPQLVGCNVGGSVYENISVTMPSHGADEDLQKVKGKHKSNMKKKFGSIFERLGKRGNPTLLDNIYTELYITTGESEGVNKEHEVWQIEDTARTKAFQDHAINCNDIFKSLDPKTEEHNDKSQSKQAVPVRTVLTKGIAGIGKTVSVQKFILDWAEGIANRDVDFVFALPFRDLNFIKDDYNLLELLSDFHPELTDIKDAKKVVDCKVVFILDGLDESQLPLDFHNNKRLSNVTKTTSVDVLLTNLIKGNLIPSALLWITSRPAAVDKIPSDCFDRVTEVRGFNDPQKEEYFKKRFSDDENLSSKIISHIKTSRSLFIMCHIPVFCWITAMVLGKMLSENDHGKVPKTLTEMYIRFLLTLTSMKNKKYNGKNEPDPRILSESDVQIILKLGKLAFQNLEKENLVFSEDDLRGCGIDVKEGFLLSGMCTELFREEDPMFRANKYSFVHLSIQEFFAALYVAYLFVSENVNPVCIKREQATKIELRVFWRRGSQQQQKTLHDLQRSAVDEALKSKTGHLDLFLRFLLGISLESNQILLKCLQLQTEGDKESIQNTIQYIKDKLSDEKQRQYPSPERCINLFHCLIELNDTSFVNEIQRFLTSKNPAEKKLTPAQCSAMAYVLLMSEEVLDKLDVREYNTSDEGRKRLVPAVRCCRKAILADCRLTTSCCETVASALQLPDSQLRELDLSGNALLDLKSLSVGLRSPNCRLESLNLSHINMGRSGPELLKAVLMGAHSQPLVLRLTSCDLKDDVCETVASALQAAGSCLTELDLSYNKLTDTGVKQISSGLMSPHCNLKILRLTGCGVTEESCGGLSSAIAVSQLEELRLGCNKLGDSGVKLLSAGLMDPHCQIQTLGLRECNLSRRSCVSLAPVLWSYSVLRELDLRDNSLWYSGMRLLSAGLRNPNCALQTLRLSGCLVTEKGCTFLASALESNPSHLNELDLSFNHPGDSGVKLLSARLEDPHCRLEKLSLDHGGESRIKPGLRKYACQLKLNCMSADFDLTLSEDNTRVVRRTQVNRYPYFDFSDSDDSDRTEKLDKWAKVRCREPLSDGRFYWQVEWTGWVDIGVTYTSRSVTEKKRSWGLFCCNEQYTFSHNIRISVVPVPRLDPKCIGVYLDFPAGALSFYSVSSGTLTHLYTFHTTFTEPLYPQFKIMCDEREIFGSVKIQTL
ncbi:LOW QUALITY PROTEIN: NACHT, LRR and PYD domains-containing protein 3-like [Coregonus clupeaformis]|uniref:LOW QUALITY PROTEIN: NACHT, LRR and PYD domains-containing protein 3-like n=1 Tax=Coregonus clupeaformis TaxID=59861 RepID=UPI001E1C25D6|nr:LOW QUALITY PROTEIN: NACHT, LRR and PYD domains-containing protein 3-like [Coregonus clupeaformis]